MVPARLSTLCIPTLGLTTSLLGTALWVNVVYLELTQRLMDCFGKYAYIYYIYLLRTGRKVFMLNSQNSRSQYATVI